MKRKTLGFLALSVSALLVLQTPTTVMAGVWVNGDETVEGNTGEHTGDVSNNYENYGSSKPEDENTIGAVGADANGDSLTVTGNITSTNEPKLTDTATGDTYYPSPVVASNGAEVTVNGNVSAQNATAVVADAEEGKPGGKVTVNGNVASEHSNAVGVFNGGNVTVTGNVTSNGDPAIIIDGDNSTVTVNGNVSSSINTEDDNSIIPGNRDVPPSVSMYGNNSTLTINGDTFGTIKTRDSDSTVNINGNITSEGTGIDLIAFGSGPVNNCTVNVKGNISSETGYGIGCCFSNINVDGNVHSNQGDALYANFSEANINGDVISDAGEAINSDSSTVNINGNVTGGKWGVYSYCGKSNVIVNGNVTSGVTTKNDGTTISHAMCLHNGASITIEGNVETANEGLDNETAIVIRKTNKAGNGKLVVLGNVTAHGKDGNAIWIDKLLNDETGQFETFQLKNLPSMLFGSLNADSKDLLIGFDTNNGNSDEENNALLESVYDNIMYYIDIKQPDNGKIDVNGAFSSDGYLVAHEDDSISISVSPNEGYEVDSVAGGKVDVIKNDDGTYTIKVPRGGGIKISALLKAIEKVIPPSSEAPVIKVTSSKKSDDTPSTPVLTAAKSYSVFNNTIQKDITSVPQNGTLKIDMGNWISFNKKTFELLSKRSDVAITITYKYNGQTYKVTIPAGYPIMDLLDENGYCGCLYLNSIFGSELVTK